MSASGFRMYSKASRDAQYELVERYAPLVKRIAYHLLARLPASVQVEDLIQKGRDLERVVLSKAVRWHIENRILLYANKTVIFD